MEQERRGLRFAFTATAEIAPASTPTALVPARVSELSLQGCFLETSVSFEMQRPVVVKIYDSGEYFETKASVLYVKPLGMGLVFVDIKPHFRAVLQKWILAALDNQPGARPTPGSPNRTSA
jgi:PilZ domain